MIYLYYGILHFYYKLNNLKSLSDACYILITESFNTYKSLGRCYDPFTFRWTKNTIKHAEAVIGRGSAWVSCIVFLKSVTLSTFDDGISHLHIFSDDTQCSYHNTLI